MRASNLVLICFLLTACSSKVEPVVVVRTETRIETPPAEWLVIPDKPVKDYRTNGELYQYSEKLEAVYDVMSETLRRIQVWSQEARSRETVETTTKK